MIRGVLLDFYGTVVDEDDEVIGAITRRIAAEKPGCSPADIAAMWGRAFAASTAAPSRTAFACSEIWQSDPSRKS